jgi:hypothetical protein
MAVSAKIYGKTFLSLANKEIDWETDTIKVMLCTSSYTPDQDAHQYKSSVTNEITGTGYTAGGATLGSAAATYTGGTNVFSLGGATVSWSTSTLTARYAVIYNSTPGTDATRPVVSYVDFGADVATTAGTLTITWDAAGICAITVA